jgi:hypothetical protein
MAKPKTKIAVVRTPDTATQPFRFEIRVRGRLDEKAWAGWFGNLSVSAGRGETRLSGAVPDHAALYALLARLRDLTIPLLSVNVLDAETERTMQRETLRQTLWMNLALLAAYGLLTGGVTAMAVFLSQAQLLHTSLAIAALFAVLGGLAFALSLAGGWRYWRWLAFGFWPAALLVFLIFTSQTRMLPVEISIALILCLSAGVVLLLAQYFQRNARRLQERLAEIRESANPAPAAPPVKPFPPAPGKKVRKTGEPQP